MGQVRGQQALLCLLPFLFVGSGFMVFFRAKSEFRDHGDTPEAYLPFKELW
jgi:hypothetical protein